MANSSDRVVCKPQARPSWVNANHTNGSVMVLASIELRAIKSGEYLLRNKKNMIVVSIPIVRTHA